MRAHRRKAERSTTNSNTQVSPDIQTGVMSFQPKRGGARRVDGVIRGAFEADIYGEFWLARDLDFLGRTWQVDHHITIEPPPRPPSQSASAKDKDKDKDECFADLHPTADWSVVKFNQPGRLERKVKATFSIRISVSRPDTAYSEAWLITDLNPEKLIDETLDAVTRSQDAERLYRNQLQVTQTGADPFRADLMRGFVSGTALCRRPSGSHTDGPRWQAFPLDEIEHSMIVEMLELEEASCSKSAPNTWEPGDLETPADLTRCKNMIEVQICHIDGESRRYELSAPSLSARTGTKVVTSVSNVKLVFCTRSDRQTIRLRDILKMFGLRAWPTPIVKPLWPFFVGAALTFYGATKLQDIGISTPEAQKDPKNPYIASQSKSNGHH